MSTVLVTGGSGFLGSHAVAALAARSDVTTVVSADVRPPAALPDGVTAVTLDVTDADAVRQAVAEHGVDVVVHLAAIVNPGTLDEATERRVDVDGTRNVLDACVAAGVRRVVVSSSGAAYGYHADNPVPLRESDVLRGNDEFTYSRHKRLVEEMLARYRDAHPGLGQVVLRIGTILGPGVSNQITALWDAPRLLRVRGSDSPFVFAWVDDVTGAIVAGATGTATGAFNVCGDGRMTVADIARRLGKKTLDVPAPVLAGALRVGRTLRLTVHGPERVGFLRYRPVLDNARLAEVLGYVPRFTSAEAFDEWLRVR
ncbi:NAD-dependent epimerase/dehydratase family protein [Isoptericola dokdonensis]|uniref:3 beta-hydroxysteroid dehydrogenase/Delta 5-->4-isomerase n=1 Tax=Isoptericola dokdonensis DS-3 TaxID=1300344 RepID=A0A161HZY0_9MICO|nr:NAD-dependent epimerase/dehydratase family protein [Isoptericola dokdonensis]ANC30365.1 3 beta-hydroxysteroid dehydrogenase/Delta 5-->4-isomerase [Isoptericola dokdonensis DS-3]